MNRIFYLDFLKGVSIFFVVLLHTAALGLSLAEIGSFTWAICNVFDSLSRFVVPVFVMISGALLLNEKRNFQLRKSVKRLLVPLVLWSMLYAFVVVAFQMRTLSLESLTAFLKLSFLTPTHNWFLFMLIGVYLITPLLKPIVQNGGGKMLIALWLVFAVLLPFCKHFTLFEPFYTFMNRFDVTLPLGYVGYFVLGHLLHSTSVFSKQSTITYILLMCLLVGVGIAAPTHYVSIAKGGLTEMFYGYMSPAVVVYSSCLFLVVKSVLRNNQFFNNQWYSKYVVLMSKYSLAIYMFHEFILILIQKIGVTPMMFNALLSVPLMALGIYIVTFVSIHLLASVPFFKNNML